MTARSTRTELVRLGLAVAALSLVLGTATASAHLRDRDRNWYFGGGTYHKDDENATGERTDPVSILFYAGGRVTPTRVTQHVADHTTLGRLAQRRCVPSRPFGSCVTRECNAESQRMLFVHHKGDRRPGSPRRSTPGHKFDLESGCGDNRYHSRLWTDREHDDHTVNHQIKDWVVGGIHYDKGENHDPGVWETIEKRFVNSMDRKHCVRKDWRYHAGSYKEGGRWRTRTQNGKISLITFAHNGEDTCAPETG